MEQRLSLVTLGVASLDVARQFYERLGWKASPVSQGDVVFFQLNGMALSLFPRTLLAQDAGIVEPGIKLDDAAPRFAGIALAYNCRSAKAVDETFTLALSAGGRAMKPPETAFWGGYSGYFADPDGYLWEVAYNPHFPLDAAGSLKLSA